MQSSTPKTSEKIILAFVGMPGAGKSEASQYLQGQGIPAVRFGDLTDEELRNKHMPRTPENERIIRESLRKEYGMAAYAVKAEPKLRALLSTHQIIIIDGLYSWEEYIHLKKIFPGLRLVHVFAQPHIRYKRLSKRPVRPLNYEESRDRDVAEIERLNKGGPIAIADYFIENNSENIQDLYASIDHLEKSLKAKK